MEAISPMSVFEMQRIQYGHRHVCRRTRDDSKEMTKLCIECRGILETQDAVCRGFEDVYPSTFPFETTFRIAESMECQERDDGLDPIE